MKEFIDNQYLQLFVIIITLLPIIVLCFKYGTNWYRKCKNMVTMKNQTDYYKKLDSDKFISWRDTQLKRMYGEEYFTDVFGTTYPAFIINFIDYLPYSDFKEVYDKNDVCLGGYTISDGEINFPPFEKTFIMSSGTKKQIAQKKKLLKSYRKILTGSIKYPKLVGFSIDHYKRNEDGRISHIYPKLGTYEFNVYSSHILEYELFKAYEKLAEEKNIPVKTLWEHLPFRHFIHFGEGQAFKKEEGLFTGIGRFSLFSVQCIVVFKDNESNNYKTLLMKRSTDPSKVSSKLGYYQFLPAGGFELYEKELIHSVEMIKQNYSLRKAIFREYLEEVFDQNDFKAVDPLTNAETTYKILNNQYIRDVIEMIEDKTATLNLLGVIVDLVTLRHTISFVLKIDDVNYSLKNFIPNDEFTRENSHSPKVRVSLEEAENLLKSKEERMGPPPMFDQASAILYKMFYDSPFYPKLENN